MESAFTLSYDIQSVFNHVISTPPLLSLQRFAPFLHGRYEPIFGLVSTVLAYALVFHKHVRHVVPCFNRHHKDKTTRNLLNTVLAVHIFAGLCEILRWHIHHVAGPKPLPDGIDVVLCMAQSSTNLILVKYLARGLPVMTRPVYQAGAVMRPVMTLFAWFTANAEWHKSSVFLVNSFIYARLLIAFVGPLMKNDHESSASGEQIYNLATFGSAVMANAEGDVPHATEIYVLLIPTLAALNRWVSTQVPVDASDSWVKQHGIGLLQQLGFIELAVMKEVEEHDHTTNAKDDEFCDEKGGRKPSVFDAVPPVSANGPTQPECGDKKVE